MLPYPTERYEQGISDQAGELDPVAWREAAIIRAREIAQHSAEEVQKLLDDVWPDQKPLDETGQQPSGG